MIFLFHKIFLNLNFSFNFVGEEIFREPQYLSEGPEYENISVKLTLDVGGVVDNGVDQVLRDPEFLAYSPNLNTINLRDQSQKIFCNVLFTPQVCHYNTVKGLVDIVDQVRGYLVNFGQQHERIQI